MDIFTLHMFFCFLFCALLGGMPVAGDMAIVLVIYFAVFFSGGFGGSVIKGVWKRSYISGNNDEARAGECAFGIPASQRSADVQKFDAFEQLYNLALSDKHGHGDGQLRIAAFKRVALLPGAMPM